MESHFTFLRTIPLFAGLADTYLEKLCQESEEIHLAAGDLLFSEGSMGNQAFVITQGQVEIFKTTNNKSVQLGVRKAGEMIGELSMIAAAPRVASGRALTDCSLLVIRSEQFDHLLTTSPDFAREVLKITTRRLLSTESLLRQNERMAQLGMFAAGMAHELNNPSAAVQRNAGQLKSALRDYQTIYGCLLASGHDETVLQEIQAIADRLLRPQPPPQRQTLEMRSKLEEDLEGWLDSLGIDEAWILGPQLLDTGISLADWQALIQTVPAERRVLLLRWAAASSTLYQLMEEIGESSARISEIVNALKSYVYLDQSPLQEVDLHKSLENTLAILRHKLVENIAVRLDFDPALPQVLAYGRELNQVWTHLIDNAIDALEGKGEITLRTAWREPWVVVDVADNGSGLSAGALQNLFSPFFTTKLVGKGAGMGLHISYSIIQKHNGDIKVLSKPGETHFEVWLPRDFEQSRREGGKAVPGEEEV